MDAARHQIVTRALGAGCREDRRLELEEALVCHAAAQAVDDLAALHDVVVNAITAKIEEAILEPDVLGIFGIAEHR